MVVALSHNPHGYGHNQKLLFQFYVGIFTHTVGVKNTLPGCFWHSRSPKQKGISFRKGLRAEFPVKDFAL